MWSFDSRTTSFRFGDAPVNLLTWKTDYSVGVAAVDDEHRELIELINTLYSRINDRSSADEIEHGLERIHNAIAMHFALEERIMRDANYDEYVDHKEDHEMLLDEIRDLMDDFLADSTVGGRKLEARLSTWFSEHFATFDARLHGKLGV